MSDTVIAPSHAIPSPTVRIRAAGAATPNGIRLLRASVPIVLLLMIAVTGCASRRTLVDTLPDAPIALLHWEGKPAERRAKAFEGAGELPPTPMNRSDPKLAEELEILAHQNGELSYGLSMRLAKTPGRLMLYWPRTEKLERVEAAPPGARPLAWSPDRSRLLFVSAHRGDRDQIFEYHLKRKDLRQLTFGPEPHSRADYLRTASPTANRSANPDASPGTGAPQAPGPATQWLPREYLVQQSQRNPRDGEFHHTLHRLAQDGRLGPELASGVRGGVLRAVPGGESVVYESVVVRPRSTGPSVLESYVAVRDLTPGSEERLLLRGREPDLTPDGEWIVFASASSAGYRLRRMRLDGTSRVPIGPGGTEERMPTVSPDGEFVAFIQETARTRRLAVRSYDGKSTRVILRTGWSEFPVW